MRGISFVPHALFAALLVSAISAPGSAGIPWRLLILSAVIEAALAVRLLIAKNAVARAAAGDTVSVLFVFLFLWHFLTAKLGVLDKTLFPQPELILGLFIRELPDMISGLWGSLTLLFSGFGLALAAAIPLGLLTGWHRRLFHAANPFAKALGPVPPIVYIPYAIALLPTFRAASIFVIFTGAFWPVFINSVNGVFSIPSGLTDTARSLDLRGWELFRKVILPGSMPSICAGASLALLFSFVLLTAAELIGATSGVGWYVKNFSDFGDYQRVRAGVIFISLIVAAITWCTERLERYLLRWRS
jgi:NitT/TauT family transport system permease protein